MEKPFRIVGAPDGAAVNAGERPTPPTAADVHDQAVEGGYSEQEAIMRLQVPDAPVHGGALPASPGDPDGARPGYNVEIQYPPADAGAARPFKLQGG